MAFCSQYELLEKDGRYAELFGLYERGISEFTVTGSLLIFLNTRYALAKNCFRNQRYQPILPEVLLSEISFIFT